MEETNSNKDLCPRGTGVDKRLRELVGTNSSSQHVGGGGGRRRKGSEDNTQVWERAFGKRDPQQSRESSTNLGRKKSKYRRPSTEVSERSARGVPFKRKAVRRGWMFGKIGGKSARGVKIFWVQKGRWCSDF